MNAALFASKNDKRHKQILNDDFSLHERKTLPAIAPIDY
jgi:hypothetical protein